uniref:Glycine N-methyltransferase n=1 Tax=Chelonoidis abingdonii TaxID=106734 RepID=A0A8C0IQG1_CHEAB
MVDSIYRTRSARGGGRRACRTIRRTGGGAVWQLYIGDIAGRTAEIPQLLLLAALRTGCLRRARRGCGTGVDSIMLVEDGFSVTSVDASDKMLKYALKERWNRRKEEAFDKWVIEEANWLTLDKDLQKPGDGFDAVICLGNSFAHLPDFKGDQSDHKLALKNIASMVRPGVSYSSPITLPCPAHLPPAHSRPSSDILSHSESWLHKSCPSLGK